MQSYWSDVLNQSLQATRPPHIPARPSSTSSCKNIRSNTNQTPQHVEDRAKSQSYSEHVAHVA
eukprot:353478-Chlamydomonas_euryale.AAC.6